MTQQLTRYQKVRAIVEAIAAGEFSRKQINPQSNGYRAGLLHNAYTRAREHGIPEGRSEEEFLYSGGTLGDGVIEKMYRNLLRLRGQNPSATTKPPASLPRRTPPRVDRKATNELSPPGVSILQEELLALRQELRHEVEALRRTSLEAQQEAEALRQEVSTLRREREEADALRRQNATLQQALTQQQQEVETLRQERKKPWAVDCTQPWAVDCTQVDKSRVDYKFEKGDLYGFALTQRKAGAGLNYYWYAGRRFNGKLCWVFVGKDKSLAKEKIEAWLAKHQSRYAEDNTRSEQNQQRSEQGDLFDGLENF